jgi:hypothetical protein
MKTLTGIERREKLAEDIKLGKVAPQEPRRGGR